MFKELDMRRAISCAIDRDRLVDIAMFGYTRAAWQSPYSDGFAKWQSRDDKPIAGCDELIDKVKARTAKAEPYELLVVSGWSDWVRAAQLAARDLSKLGLDVKVRTLEFGIKDENFKKGIKKINSLARLQEIKSGILKDLVKNNKFINSYFGKIYKN